MAWIFGGIAGVLFMLTVAGLIGVVEILVIATGLIIGGSLIAPQLSGKVSLKK